MSEKQSALDFQQDGDHYKKLKMQPLELAYRVNGSPCFTKLAKYASRRKVDRLGDLKKAIHCIQLEKELTFLTKDSYKEIMVSEKDFFENLTKFCQKGFLYNALASMYYKSYDDAIIWVELIIKEEFPNET